ncbi:MAG: hypothetical protein ACFB15_11680 [Cyclobacteriaceae bacterium]
MFNQPLGFSFYAPVASQAHDFEVIARPTGGIHFFADEATLSAHYATVHGT